MIRILIVDDEEPARSKLAKFLAREHGVEVVGQASDGAQAISLIGEIKPDLVFLDVQMPRISGLDVVRQLDPRTTPWIVFVTAYDQHALTAFEMQAIDYLLKPYARGRLHQSLERVRARMATEQRADTADRLERLLESREFEPLEHILVKKAIHREILLPLSDVDILRAKGNYVELVAANTTYRCRGPLSKLATRLDQRRFLQINRGEIVRLAAVQEFQPWFRGDYRVVMAHGEILNWSRRFRKTEQARQLLAAATNL